MEKSNSVHVSPYISKSIGSHIKSQNDRSKRTKEIYKELRNVNKIYTGSNNTGFNIKILSAPASRNLSDIREKLKNSGNLIKSAAAANANSGILGFGNNSAKFFGKDLNLNTINNNIVGNYNGNINNDIIGNSHEEINSYKGIGNFSNNFEKKNITNFSSSNDCNSVNIKTPVFRQLDNNNFFNYTPENNNNLNNSNKFSLEANSSESFKDNSNFNKEFLLNKNLSFNSTEQDKDNISNNDTNNNDNSNN